MRIGVLTGGGDCPGLNAVIRAIVRKGVGDYGHEFVGYRDGWRGPLEGDSRPLGVPEVRGHPARAAAPSSAPRAPTPSRRRTARKRRRPRWTADGVDGLIAIGGEDTLGVATKLGDEGVKVVGVPKTIDNDLGATDYTFGFDTAVNIAMEAIDRLHTTAESHHRALIVEVMGRHAGWIAFHAGVAGGANVILIPELEFDIEQVCEYIERRYREPVLADPRRRRGRASRGRRPRAGRRPDRRLRPRSPRRHRAVARGRDREADGPRGSGDGARPRPARRHADGLRPGARHPLRPARDRCRRRGGVGQDDRAARAPTSSWSTWRRRPPS